MTNFFNLIEETYLEFGFDPNLQLGYEILDMSRIFSKSSCLPIFVMILNSNYIRSTGNSLINDNGGFRRSAQSTFGIQCTSHVFKPDITIPKDIVVMSVKTLGELLCGGINNFSWQLLLVDYIENLNRDKPLANMHDDGFLITYRN